MAYYHDFTPYQYGHTEPHPDVVNIGWLSSEQPYSRAPPNEDLVAALRQLTASPVNLYRGSHLCEFCPTPPTVPSKSGIPMLGPFPGTTGNGEIRVQGKGRVTYVAPVLILHYVIEHQYSPPQEFIDAVLIDAKR